ncbi:myocilin [Microdochium nivale]|nr:myocilin [Microdochium nivale]
MDANQDLALGATCDNWLRGISCNCRECGQFTCNALGTFMPPNSQLGLEQSTLIDPRLLQFNTVNLPNINFHGLPSLSPLYDNTGDTLGLSLGLGSPIQLSQVKSNTSPDPNDLSMLPMPSLPPLQKMTPPTSNSTRYNTRSRATSQHGLPDMRPRSSSINTIASSDLSDAFSPSWCGTSGSESQATSASATTFVSAMSFDNPLHHGSPDGTSSAQYSPQPQPYTNLHQPDPSSLSLSTTTAATAAAKLQKPRPYDVPQDAPEAEKARLGELNSAIFAERLRIQRAKNNCAAKKSRQRRLDLIQDLQSQLALKSAELDAATAQVATCKAELADGQRQCGELQRQNAELLQRMVSSQQDVLSSRALREENARLRTDIGSLQRLVRSLALKPGPEGAAATTAASAISTTGSGSDADSGNTNSAGSPQSSSVAGSTGTTMTTSPFSSMAGDDYFS